MALNLAVIVIVCLFLDALLRRLRLPGLLGMLLVGILATPQAKTTIRFLAGRYATEATGNRGCTS